MKSVLVGGAIALALSWGYPVAAQQVVTGNTLLERAAAVKRMDAGSTSPKDLQDYLYFVGFAFGVASTLDNVDPEVCLPVASNTGQYRRVLIQYLEANPAELHMSGTILAIAAFRKAFPCRK